VFVRIGQCICVYLTDFFSDIRMNIIIRYIYTHIPNLTIYSLYREYNNITLLFGAREALRVWYKEEEEEEEEDTYMYTTSAARFSSIYICVYLLCIHEWVYKCIYIHT